MNWIFLSSETWCPPHPATPMATQKSCSRGWSSLPYQQLAHKVILTILEVGPDALHKVQEDLPWGLLGAPSQPIKLLLLGTKIAPLLSFSDPSTGGSGHNVPLSSPKSVIALSPKRDLSPTNDFKQVPNLGPRPALDKSSPQTNKSDKSELANPESNTRENPRIDIIVNVKPWNTKEQIETNIEYFLVRFWLGICWNFTKILPNLLIYCNFTLQTTSNSPCGCARLLFAK